MSRFGPMRRLSAVVVLFALAGCGGSPKEAMNAESAPAGKAAQAKKAPDAKAQPTKPKDDDDEANTPYGVTSLDTSTRCPLLLAATTGG